MVIPEYTPISALQRNYSAVIQKLEDGPVILAQHSRPIAVVLSTGQYERMETELKRLRRIVQADEDFAEMRAGNYTNLNDLLAGHNANPS